MPTPISLPTRCADQTCPEPQMPCFQPSSDQRRVKNTGGFIPFSLVAKKGPRNGAIAQTRAAQTMPGVPAHPSYKVLVGPARHAFARGCMRNLRPWLWGFKTKSQVSYSKECCMARLGARNRLRIWTKD